MLRQFRVNKPQWSLSPVGSEHKGGEQVFHCSHKTFYFLMHAVSSDGLLHIYQTNSKFCHSRQKWQSSYTALAFTERLQIYIAYLDKLLTLKLISTRGHTCYLYWIWNAQIWTQSWLSPAKSCFVHPVSLFTCNVLDTMSPINRGTCTIALHDWFWQL